MGNDPLEEAREKKIPLASTQPTTLNFVVERPNNEPVSGALVTVGLAPKPRTATTNAQGKTTIILTPTEAATVTDSKVPLSVEKPIQGGNQPGGQQHGVTKQSTTETLTINPGNPTLNIVTLEDPCLLAFPKPNPNTDIVLARNLTLQQARDTLVHLHKTGEIVLLPEPTFEHNAKGCVVVTPEANNTKRVSMRPRVKILRGAVVAKTVEYRIIQTFDSQKKTVGPSSANDLQLLQHRHAVGLQRLAKFLGDDSGWGIVKIFSAGINGSSPTGPNRHTRGHCIDFSGVEGIEGTGPDVGKPFQMTVVFDWGGAATPALDFSDRQNPTVKSPVAKGASSPSWPSGDTATLPYRLEHFGSPNDNPRRFFLDLYQWFSREYCQDSQRPGTIVLAGTPGRPGDRSGMLVHPDYPKEDPNGKSGRVAHVNHYHAEMPDDLP